MIKPIAMKYSIIILVFFTLNLFSQNKEESVIEIKGVTTCLKNEYSLKLSEVTINVYNLNDKIGTYISDERGKFEFEIQTNTYTMLEFEKEGFVSKRILFDTRSIDIDHKKSYKPFDLEIFLLDFKKLVYYDDVEFPITRVEYSKEEKDFIYAPRYTEKMLEKQEKLIEEITGLN